eukprot:Rhum_TRINITY_DN13848_c0_g1::Rhum_TRINITY_DN13848_c0_g1_i1::g.64440::m.64440
MPPASGKGRAPWTGSATSTEAARRCLRRHRTRRLRRAVRPAARRTGREEGGSAPGRSWACASGPPPPCSSWRPLSGTPCSGVGAAVSRLPRPSRTGQARPTNPRRFPGTLPFLLLRRRLSFAALASDGGKTISGLLPPFSYRLRRSTKTKRENNCKKIKIKCNNNNNTSTQCPVQEGGLLSIFRGEFITPLPPPQQTRATPVREPILYIFSPHTSLPHTLPHPHPPPSVRLAYFGVPDNAKDEGGKRGRMSVPFTTVRLFFCFFLFPQHAHTALIAYDSAKKQVTVSSCRLFSLFCLSCWETTHRSLSFSQATQVHY